MIAHWATERATTLNENVHAAVRVRILKTLCDPAELKAARDQEGPQAPPEQ